MTLQEEEVEDDCVYATFPAGPGCTCLVPHLLTVVALPWGLILQLCRGNTGLDPLAWWARSQLAELKKG